MTTLLLDLHAVDFYGFQSGLDRDHLASILGSIDAGDPFEPLAVRKVFERDIYFLDATVLDPISKSPEGGHTRAIAHYLAKKPLRCSLTGVSHLPSAPEGFFLIREISVTDSYGEGNVLFGKIDLRSGAIHKMSSDTRYR